MPGGDGTGPLGFGPGSGRGAGYCLGYPAPGFANSLPGGMRRRGFAYRRPRLYRSIPDEKELLEREANYLREELKLLEERLNTLSRSENNA